jgi:hypothetical protein
VRWAQGTCEIMFHTATLMERPPPRHAPAATAPPTPPPPATAATAAAATSAMQEPINAAAGVGGLDSVGVGGGQEGGHTAEGVGEVPPHVPPAPRQGGAEFLTARKRHIGNDYVTIVFQEEGGAFQQDTLAGQFNFVHLLVRSPVAHRRKGFRWREYKLLGVGLNYVLTPHTAHRTPTPPFSPPPLPQVHPLAGELYRVRVQAKGGLPPFGPLHGVSVVPSACLAHLLRQTAINACIACRSLHRGQVEHRCNAQERLSQLALIRERLTGSSSSSSSRQQQQQDWPLTLWDVTRMTSGWELRPPRVDSMVSVDNR